MTTVCQELLKILKGGGGDIPGSNLKVQVRVRVKLRVWSRC